MLLFILPIPLWMKEKIAGFISRLTDTEHIFIGAYSQKSYENYLRKSGQNPEKGTRISSKLALTRWLPFHRN